MHSTRHKPISCHQCICVRFNWGLLHKCSQRQEFVIGGYTDPQGSRVGFGAFLVGIYDEDKKLRYAGSVGTGYSIKTLHKLKAELDKIETAVVGVLREVYVSFFSPIRFTGYNNRLASISFFDDDVEMISWRVGSARLTFRLPRLPGALLLNDSRNEI